MRYNRDRFSVDAAKRKGRPLPDWYLDEPVIEASDMFYIKAFYDLNTCRSVGMGMGPIPWRDIISYAHFYQLDEDIVEAFVDIIREMDDAFLKWQSDEQEKIRQRNLPKTNRRSKT